MMTIRNKSRKNNIEYAQQPASQPVPQPPARPMTQLRPSQELHEASDELRYYEWKQEASQVKAKQRQADPKTRPAHCRLVRHHCLLVPLLCSALLCSALLCSAYTSYEGCNFNILSSVATPMPCPPSAPPSLSPPLTSMIAPSCFTIRRIT